MRFAHGVDHAPVHCGDSWTMEHALGQAEVVDGVQRIA
jgi:hypothetical protein